MSENVGLSTPRGSGTSGYVQRNLSHLKPRQHPYSRSPLSTSTSHDTSGPSYRQRQPDAEILDHERKRAIEVQVFELRDRLEEEGKLDEDEVDAQCETLRRKLTAPVPSGPAAAKRTKEGDGTRRELKRYQVHELAEEKIKEDEKVRRAFGISKDYEEGGHWKRQEERRREAMAKSVGAEAGREDD